MWKTRVQRHVGMGSSLSVQKNATTATPMTATGVRAAVEWKKAGCVLATGVLKGPVRRSVETEGC